LSLDYLVAQYNEGRQLIFDLDNTIYCETDFLFKAYTEIATVFEPFYKIDDVFEFLRNTFLNKGRSQIFNKLIVNYDEMRITVPECLAILRDYKCNSCIETYPWFKEFTDRVDTSFHLNIITNGNVQQQKNKVASIKFPIQKNRITVFYANETKPKPAPDSFHWFRQKIQARDPIYIGDSIIDKQFCSALNIEFYDVGNVI